VHMAGKAVVFLVVASPAGVLCNSRTILLLPARAAPPHKLCHAQYMEWPRRQYVPTVHNNSCSAQLRARSTTCCEAARFGLL